jgi:hypothetical protein
MVTRDQVLANKKQTGRYQSERTGLIQEYIEAHPNHNDFTASRSLDADRNR